VSLVVVSLGGSKYQIAAQRENFATVLSAMDRGTVMCWPRGKNGKMVVVESTWTSKVGA